MHFKGSLKKGLTPPKQHIVKLKLKQSIIVIDEGVRPL
ncbi:hypothetical protein MGA3_04015 [Bacillus methanolicus MGA3]|nr:hypothetical protein MGA3_04015 [Bacillus methanolicus MGA3]